MSAAGDPGLQPERTALAWSRTGLALLGNALLLLRAGMQGPSTPLLAAGAGLGIAAGALFLVGRQRRRQLLEPGVAAPATWLMAVTACAVTAAAAAGGWALLQ